MHLYHSADDDLAPMSSPFASPVSRRAMTTLVSFGRTTLLAFAALLLVAAIAGCSSGNPASESHASQNAAPQHDTGSPAVVAEAAVTGLQAQRDKTTHRLLGSASRAVLTLDDEA